MKRRFITKIKDSQGTKYFLFGIPIWRKKRKEISRLRESVEQLLNQREYDFYRLYTAIQHMRTTDLYAQMHHPAVFEKYREIHTGQDIVIVGAGPTLDDYTPIPGAIHIGVNRTYQCKKLQLDYLFAQDGGPVTELKELTNYRKGKCRKFFGIHPIKEVTQFSESFVKENEAERYYFINMNPKDSYLSLPLDLAHQPLACAYSVITCAFQFALWCRPRRIYIVGCDCSSSGYFQGDSGVCKQYLPTNELQQEWAWLADFAKRYYRDVEIISINPVGLKGLFKDEVTK